MQLPVLLLPILFGVCLGVVITLSSLLLASYLTKMCTLKSAIHLADLKSKKNSSVQTPN